MMASHRGRFESIGRSVVLVTADSNSVVGRYIGPANRPEGQEGIERKAESFSKEDLEKDENHPCCSSDEPGVRHDGTRFVKSNLLVSKWCDDGTVSIAVVPGTPAQTCPNGSCNENSTGSYITNKNGSYIKNGNGSYITNENSSYITNENGSYIRNENGSYITNENGSYITNENGSYMKNRNGSYMKNRNGSYTANECGSGDTQTIVIYDENASFNELEYEDDSYSLDENESCHPLASGCDHDTGSCDEGSTIYVPWNVSLDDQFCTISDPFFEDNFLDDRHSIGLSSPAPSEDTTSSSRPTDVTLDYFLQSEDFPEDLQSDEEQVSLKIVNS